MVSGSRKRKHHSHRNRTPPSPHFKLQSHYGSSSHYPRTHSEIDSQFTDDTTTKPDPLHALYIQAYEADIVRGSHAQTAAQSLEVVEYSTPTTIIPKIGSALIRLGGDTSSIGPQHYGVDDGDNEDTMPLATQNTASAIWVDR